MKRRHIVLINMIFLGLMLFSAATVYQFMTGIKPLDALKRFGHHSKTEVVTTDNCSTQKPLDLKGAKAAPLVKLGVYQQACHSYVTGTVMVFVSMPTTADEAVSYAKEDAAMLQDFSKHGVRPLVIAEPTDKEGTQIDFALTANGAYNSAYAAYFQALKSNGITDSQLGIWTPFPEANLPYWKNNEPQYFAPSVNNYVAALRAAFPTAQTSVMLNSATYSTSDFNWENGDYSSLLPYVKGITPGSINYAGLQGFPWMSRAGGSGAILNAAEFLNPEILTEMADSLGTKKVWFNTGSFASKYTLDPEATVTMTPERRKAVLATVATQAEILKNKGYDISVNIFAQDKSKASEETNWSYWSNNNPFGSKDAPVITEFISDLNSKNIPFWVFDR